MKLSLIIPTYNEELVIEETLNQAQAYLNRKFVNDYEIIVVDDCSVDKTVELVKNFSKVKLIKKNSNEGKGAAIKTGVLASRGEWLLFMDADNSTKITELDNFFRYTDDYQVIIASRALSDSLVPVKQSFIKTSLGRLGNLFIQLMLLPGIKDSRCGFKLYRSDLRKIFQNQLFKGWSFDDEVLYLAKKSGYKIKELPVTWINNFDSTVKPFDYLATLFDLFRVKLNYWRGRYKF